MMLGRGGVVFTLRPLMNVRNRLIRLRSAGGSIWDIFIDRGSVSFRRGG